MANYNSNYTGAQIDSAVGKIVANSGTSGQLLTADGQGGASWQNASGDTLYMHSVYWFGDSPSFPNKLFFINKDSNSYTSISDIITFLNSMGRTSEYYAYQCTGTVLTTTDGNRWYTISSMFINTSDLRVNGLVYISGSTTFSGVNLTGTTTITDNVVAI